MLSNLPSTKPQNVLLGMQNLATCLSVLFAVDQKSWIRSQVFVSWKWTVQINRISRNIEPNSIYGYQVQPDHTFTNVTNCYTMHVVYLNCLTFNNP